jgi:HlyD family secretion protein
MMVRQTPRRSQVMSGRKKIGMLVLTAVVVAGAGTTFALRGGAEETTAPGVAVSRGDVVAQALAVGTIVPEVEVSVKSKVSGVVQKRFADVGDVVAAGAPLLEIHPDPTPMELADARRQVELRQLELDNVAREMARQQELRSRGLISEQEFEQSQRRSAEARLQSQMATERLALLEKGRVTGATGVTLESVIRSPIDGYILEKLVEVGDPVVPLSTYQEGTVLLKMADMKKLIFRGTVDEIDVGRLQEGMPVVIKVGALPNVPVEGVLTRISLKAQRQENATVFPVEITLTESGSAVLRAGYSASAEIIIDRREQALVIPERLVHFEGDSAWVEVAGADGARVKRKLETGLSDAIRIEVVSGLEEGERVLEKPRREIS